MRCLKFILSAIVLTGILSCGPVISKQTMSYVDPNITFQELIKNPDTYKGKTVVLGGRIVSTSVMPTESTIEILQQPLEYRQKPQNEDVSYGRFLVRFPDYRDPAVYAPGRSITVAGQVAGREIRKLAQIDYSYPLLIGKEAHLWKMEDIYSSEPQFHFGIGIGIIH